MRNFWIDAAIDNRTSRLRGGPRRRDGGFDMTIYVKDNGESVEALTVLGRVLPDGSLRLVAQAPNGDRVVTTATG